MIGCDADVRGTVGDHLQHGVEHTHHGAERAVVPLGKPPQSVKMAEKLVRTVDEVNDHLNVILRTSLLLLRSLRLSEQGILPNLVIGTSDVSSILSSCRKAKEWSFESLDSAENRHFGVKRGPLAIPSDSRRPRD
jgi:hypothetical protein